MRLFPAILANTLVVVSAFGFGGLLRYLFPVSYSRLERATLALLGGFGILGLLLFCLGQVWFSLTSILIVLSAGCLLSIGPFLRAIREFRSCLKELQLPALPVVIISAVLLVTTISGLALPVGDMNNDSVAYHYLGPTVWLQHGVVRAVPHEVLTYFPVVIETQYAALMAIGGQRAPQFFSVVSFVVLLLIAAALAIRMGLDHSEVWWALAIIATMPAVYRGVYGGMIDAFFAAFLLAAARIGFDAERPKDFVLFGIFCAIAMGTKYTAIIAVIILVYGSFLSAVRAKTLPAQRVLQYLIGSSILALAVASPFYLRNWIVYGCPIYPPPPGLLRFFPHTEISQGVLKELLTNVTVTGRGMGSSAVDFLLLPFNLTFHTADFRGAGGIGLVPLALAPFGLLLVRRDAFDVPVALFAVMETATWFITAQVSRYLIAVYVIAAIFGVLGWRYVARRASQSGRLLACIAVATSIVYGLAMIIPERREDIHAALSNTYEAARRHREIPFIEGFEYINREPSVHKVLVLNAYVATYFITKEYIKPFGRWGERTLAGAATVSEVMAQLPDLQVTHILDVKLDSGDFDLPDDPPGLQKVFEREGERIYRVER